MDLGVVALPHTDSFSTIANTEIEAKGLDYRLTIGLSQESNSAILVHRKIYFVFENPRSARVLKNKMLQNLSVATLVCFKT
jgi:hypothetical protein